MGERYPINPIIKKPKTKIEIFGVRTSQMNGDKTIDNKLSMMEDDVFGVSCANHSPSFFDIKQIIVS